ncbi:NAD(+) synthase [Phenylobacterium montanum]|uniref:Glutamine-dependent NAD(+) synthetase n=1 Tax=Phenylobacterium montanum TaxID=2823693 RepID=A0A975IWC4_9CAUL|nr:NAD(+) synthase [Caulobacter sp. S6]QUD88246.1 NAD(+) synthase [Caulobacter sp. S6]
MPYDFHSLYSHDFLRVAAATPRVAVADPAFNLAETLKLAREADAKKAGLIAFPELGISAYAIDDLLLQDALLEAVDRALVDLVEASRDLYPVIVVGAPLGLDGRLYNTAVAIHRGEVLGVVPKTYLPNYREFYERRHFTPGVGVQGRTIAVAGQEAPFGVDLLFRSVGEVAFTFHVEICEDVWVPIPPSSHAALAGAEVLVNLSASNIAIGKAETRKLLCASQSARAQAAYVYTAAGPGESTTDLAWDGQAGVYECGRVLNETPRFVSGSIAFADVDLGRIRQERMRMGSFGDNARSEAERVEAFSYALFELDAPEEAVALERPIERFPFVPSDPSRLAEDCYEAYNIQVQGLAKRLEASGAKKIVIGVSGGLDSTQALLVAVRAMDRLGRPRSDILAYTLPGFATSEGTKSNAWALIKAIGATGGEIDIRPAAERMLADIGHPYAAGQKQYDVTFENVQAGLRTDYLFRLANHHGGIVLGTGDLSELALGWCTYGVGDQMSHYNVNSGVSKTLIQHLIRFVANSGDVDAATAKLLLDILATEISPELVPADADGAIQSTEAMVGPYALQDFTLHYVARYGFRPSKIAFLALSAWGDVEKGAWPENTPDSARRAYSLAEIRRWMEVFLTRFFATSQFKRSAVPNGPKISSAGALSPRGDWRAPSDGNAKLWLAELKEKVPAG